MDIYEINADTLQKKKGDTVLPMEFIGFSTINQLPVHNYSDLEKTIIAIELNEDNNSAVIKLK